MHRCSLRLAIAATMALPFATADAGAPQSKTQAPAFYRMMLGDYQVTVLWDGTAERKMDQIMSKPGEVREVYERDHQTLPVQMSINTFLINTGSQLVLIDTGGGRFVGDRAGRMVANLRASGYRPEQIDAVLLTHLHPDHFGGLIDADRRVFPNAVVHVNKRDVDFWLGDADAEMTPTQRSMSQQAHAALDPYKTTGQLRPFDAAFAPFPGIRAVPEPGHTVGHTGYSVESNGKQLLLWGDIVHSVETQFLDPEITIAFDMNPQDAIASRKRAFAQAGEQGYVVGSAHITFPGLGHVGSDGRVYSWVQLPYAEL